MRLDRKLLAALLTACLLLGLFPSALAADLSQARFGSIATAGYSRTLIFYGNAVPASNTDGKWGLIDRTGRALSSFAYNWIYPVDDGLATPAGEKHGLFAAMASDRTDFLNDQGRVLLSLADDNFRQMTTGFCTASWSDGGQQTQTFYDWEGRRISSPLENYSSWWYYPGTDTYTVLKRQDDVSKAGILDRDLNVVVPAAYDEVDRFSDGSGHYLAVAEPGEDNTGGYALLLDESGGTLKRFQSASYRWEDDLIKFYETGRQGLADSGGNVLVPPGLYLEFGELNPQGCIAAVQGIAGADSQVYQNGKLILEHTDAFTDGYLNTQAGLPGILISSEIPSRDGLKGLLDLTGKEILPRKFQTIEGDDNGNLIVSTGNCANLNCGCGVYAMDGSCILEPVYSEIECLTDGYYLVCDGKHYYVTNGTDSLPGVYTEGTAILPSVVSLYDGQHYRLVNGRGELLAPPCDEIRMGFTPIYGDSPYYTRFEQKVHGASSAVPFWCIDGGETSTVYVDFGTGAVVRTMEGRNGPVNSEGMFVRYEADGTQRLGTLTPAETGYVASCSAVLSGGQVRVTASLARPAEGVELLAGLYAGDGQFLGAAAMTVSGSAATAALPGGGGADRVQIFVTSPGDRTPLEPPASARVGT